MVGRTLRLVKRWPAVTAFVVVFLAGMVAWGFDRHQGSQRLRERRQDVSLVCAYVNDTRSELRGIVAESSGLDTLPPQLIPEELRPLLEQLKEQGEQRQRETLERLADYDCEAFLSGEKPKPPTSRTTTTTASTARG